MNTTDILNNTQDIGQCGVLILMIILSATVAWYLGNLPCEGPVLKRLSCRWRKIIQHHSTQPFHPQSPEFEIRHEEERSVDEHSSTDLSSLRGCRRRCCTLESKNVSSQDIAQKRSPSHISFSPTWLPRSCHWGSCPHTWRVQRCCLQL